MTAEGCYEGAALSPDRRNEDLADSRLSLIRLAG